MRASADPDLLTCDIERADACTPSVLRLSLAVAASSTALSRRLAGLSTLVVERRGLVATLLRELQLRIGGRLRRLINLYGPTETTVLRDHVVQPR